MKAVVIIVAMLVILGAVIFYLVQRAASSAARATQGAGDIDPVTGQRWQTIEDARHQADAHAATQESSSMVQA